MSADGLLVEDVAVSFGAAKVLRRVNLAVGPGEVVGLVGPNGAGKTTTLRTISGLIRPEAGRILVAGVGFVGQPDKIASAGVVHVPEGRGLFPDLTVRQNLRVGAVAVGRDVSDEDIQRTVTLFPKLERYMHSRAGLLSGGEQQMVAIARGFLAKPKVLMIDEMSLGLAPAVIHVILRAMLDEAREAGVGMLVVDQNVRLLTQTCDRILILDGGITIDASDAGGELVRSAYFGGP
jgi:branched-chain amino acid transport system ATP-binding protein